METSKNVVFSLEEVNNILTYLGDVPAKFSLDLITFIRTKAQEQVGDESTSTADASPVSDAEVVPS